MSEEIKTLMDDLNKSFEDIYDIYASYSFLSLHGYVVRKRVCLSHIIKTFDLLDEAAQDFQHAILFLYRRYRLVRG